jgi:hypothetical protein
MTTIAMEMTTNISAGRTERDGAGPPKLCDAPSNVRFPFSTPRLRRKSSFFMNALSFTIATKYPAPLRSTSQIRTFYSFDSPLRITEIKAPLNTCDHMVSSPLHRNDNSCVGESEDLT